MYLRPDQAVTALYNPIEGTTEVSTVTLSGTAASLNNKYFLFSSSSVNYYAWFNYNSTGADPVLAGKTAVPIAVAVAATLATVATNTAAAIDAKALISSVADGSNVVIRADAVGTITDTSAGNSGFTIVVNNQGRVQWGEYPGKLVDSHTNNPSTVA